MTNDALKALDDVFFDMEGNREYWPPETVKQYETIRAALTQPKADVGKAIHYPDCWDVAAYPTVEDAYHELVNDFKCTNDDCTTPKADVDELVSSTIDRLGVVLPIETDLVSDVINDLRAQGYIGVPEGYALVPIEPTREMLNSAIDAHGHKLCDISGIGFRISPQQMFEQSYKAMIKAAPKKEGV